MTDHERAIAIGHYINGLLLEIETLKGVLKYRTENPEAAQRISPQEMRRQVSEDETFHRTAESHRSTLLHALSDETQALALIRALCRNYFPEQGSHLP